MNITSTIQHFLALHFVAPPALPLFATALLRVHLNKKTFQNFLNWHLPLKVNNRNTKTRCEICSKLLINTLKAPCSGASIVNFE